MVAVQTCSEANHQAFVASRSAASPAGPSEHHRLLRQASRRDRSGTGSSAGGEDRPSDLSADECCWTRAAPAKSRLPARTGLFDEQQSDQLANLTADSGQTAELFLVQRRKIVAEILHQISKHLMSDVQSKGSIEKVQRAVKGVLVVLVNHLHAAGSKAFSVDPALISQSVVLHRGNEGRGKGSQFLVADQQRRNRGIESLTSIGNQRGIAGLAVVQRLFVHFTVLGRDQGPIDEGTELLLLLQRGVIVDQNVVADRFVQVEFQDETSPPEVEELQTRLDVRRKHLVEELNHGIDQHLHPRTILTGRVSGESHAEHCREVAP